MQNTSEWLDRALYDAQHSLASSLEDGWTELYLPQLRAAIEARIAAERAEAAEQTRNLVEHEAHDRAFYKMRDELEKARHPAIRVDRKEKDYLVAEMIEDIKYGGDRINVIIAAQSKPKPTEVTLTDDQEKPLKNIMDLL